MPIYTGGDEGGTRPPASGSIYTGGGGGGQETRIAQSMVDYLRSFQENIQGRVGELQRQHGLARQQLRGQLAERGIFGSGVGQQMETDLGARLQSAIQQEQFKIQQQRQKLITDLLQAGWPPNSIMKMLKGIGGGGGEGGGAGGEPPTGGAGGGEGGGFTPPDPNRPVVPPPGMDVPDYTPGGGGGGTPPIPQGGYLPSLDPWREGGTPLTFGALGTALSRALKTVKQGQGAMPTGRISEFLAQAQGLPGFEQALAGTPGLRSQEGPRMAFGQLQQYAGGRSLADIFG